MFDKKQYETFPQVFEVIEILGYFQIPEIDKQYKLICSIIDFLKIEQKHNCCFIQRGLDF